MNSRWITLIAISAMPLLVPACTRSPAGEEKNVEQTLAKYIQSVNTADLKLASEVWLQTPVVSAVTPFGRFQGWESVRDSIYITFLQKAFTERRLEPSNIEVHVSANTAWAAFDWTFVSTLANGQAHTSKGWETQIYQRTSQGWRLVHSHYSVPPPRS